jgi:flagellin-specific chaperone FliS
MLPVQVQQIQAYRRQQVEAASPGQLVLIALEQGVAACRRGMRGRAQRAVQELIVALDFEQAEIAGGLLRLYDWVLQLLREGRSAEAAEILDELRRTWAEALRQEEANRRATGV